MPQRDPGVYLEDIERHASAAVRFVSGYSLEQYLSDEKTKAAVERVLEVCGEAMRGLYQAAPKSQKGYPMRATSSGSATFWRMDTRNSTMTRSTTSPRCTRRWLPREALKAFPDPAAEQP